MIGRLRGKILEKSPPNILLDVHGVGYEIESPMSTFYKLPLDGNEDVVIHTHLVVRDDAHLLFGFASLTERTMFRTLIKVNGVGAKMALAVLSSMEADEFARCINTEDTNALTRVPGIGKKTAERLIVEMRDKLHEDVRGVTASVGATMTTAGDAEGMILSANPKSQAQAALESLGYKAAEASRMVATVKEKGLNTEEVIRVALQNSMRK